MDLEGAVNIARKERKLDPCRNIPELPLLAALEEAAPIIEELQNECLRIDAKHGGRDAEHDVNAPMAKAMLFGGVLRAAGLLGDQWEVRSNSLNGFAVAKNGKALGYFMSKALAEEYLALMRAKD